MRRGFWALALALALVGAGSPANGAVGPACLSADAGPFTVTETASGVGHTIFHPTELCRAHPVILWGNGTGSTPATYAKLLRHLASHGFIVAAADTSWSGSGREMLAGLDYLTAQHNTPGSVFHQRVALDRVGSAGHSQGGGGALNAGADPRVGTVVPIQPGPDGDPKRLHGPTFYLAGQVDPIVLPYLLVYPPYLNSGHVVAIYGELAGAGHGEPTGDGGGYREAVTAWFRFHLLGDERARGMFFGRDCGYCDAPQWSRFERNARAQAVRGS